MKVKYLFGALVLPVAFSACTSEEFEFAQTPSLNGSALDGRTKGVVTLSVDKADVEDENSTRVNGAQVPGTNSISWQWMNADDKLGGVVVDYKADGSIVEHNYLGAKGYVITNYPFAPQIDGPSATADFTTPTAVVQGAYMFYSQYDGNAVQRGVVEDKIARIQTVNAGWEKGLEQVGSDATVGGENFFVSPIADLAVADGAENENPLTLTSAHALLHIKLNSDVESKYYDGDGFQINKIVLRAMGDTDKFNLAQTINPIEISNIQAQVYNELKEKNNKIYEAFRVVKTEAGVATQATIVQPSKTIPSDKVRAAMKCVLNKIQGKDILTGKENTEAISDISEYGTETTTDLVYQLETPFSFKKADDVFELLVIIPEGKYTKNSTPAKEYQGKTEGVWHMTVYTSEGTYDEYIGKDKIVAHRGKKLNIHDRTLTIKGGQTNINLFDPNEAFNIESTEDYNYVIEYVNNHFRDFGNASDWKAPVLNLVAGKTIDVDAAHMFPNFPVKYIGGATLNVKGQNATYEFNPKNIILGTDANRPTIKIDDAGSTIKFTTSVDATAGVDGVDATCALKLDSKAKIEIAECDKVGKMVVNFEKLVSGTNMNIGKKATVNVSGTTETKGALTVGEEADVNLTGDATFNGTTTVGKKAQVDAAAKLTTNGVVNVNEGAVITVNGAYTNGSTMTIDKLAKVTLKNTSSNTGAITLEGTAELISATSFENKKNATILVKKCDNQMNDKTRAKAEFKDLKNAGNITLEASVDKKGTYGAYVNIAGTFTNEETGKVSNNGEFKVNAIANSGNITLESDPYALISVNSGFYTNTTTNKGSVVLADPTEYEMYDSYYTGRNDLIDTDIEGVVEATINQESYNKIYANYTSTALAGQEKALDVLNKITVDGELKVKNASLDNVDFVLPANAKLVAEQTNLVINSLTANGASSLTTNLPNNDEATVTIKEMVNVNADFTIDSRINAVLTVNFEQTVDKKYYGILNVNNGTFTNNGSINGSITTKNPIFAAISANATLKNNGTIGQFTPAKDAVVEYYSASELAAFNAFNKAYNDFQNAKYYIRRLDGTVASNSSEWNGSSVIVRDNFESFTVWKLWVAAGCPSYFTNGNFSWKIYLKNDGKYDPVPAVAAEVAALVNETKPSVNKTTGAPDQANLIDGRTTVITEAAKSFTASEPAKLGNYIIVRNNFGTFDMTADKCYTIGDIADNTKGTKKGEFTVKVLESSMVTLGGMVP